MRGIAGDHHVNGGDLGCWRLLLMLRDQVADLPDGAVVHLTTNDAIAPIDLPAWCRITDHTYLGAVGSHDGRPTYGVRVTARPVATDPRFPWRAAP